MPDLITFARKHITTAQRNGSVAGLSAALSEIAIWSYSRAHERILDRERIIWADDWDICIIIDACRYDILIEVAYEYDWLPWNLPAAWSAGSASPEWYGRTFDPDVLPDERVGLVTANPFAAKPAERHPYLRGSTPVDPRIDYCDYVFRDSWGCKVNDGYLDVTHPAVVTDRAHAAWQNHGLDRLVVHYMQPHIPFRSRPEWFGGRENLRHFGEPDKEGGESIWHRLRDGRADRQEVRAAYVDNLRWVLGDIRRLHRAVDAELLLTSDHGNGMGEWGIWSHPPGIHAPCVRKVPWVHLTGEGGGSIESREVDAADEKGDDLTVDEQLKALGYM